VVSYVARLTLANTSLTAAHREMPVDLGRNFPDLGARFAAGERAAREAHVARSGEAAPTDTRAPEWADTPENDERDLAWSAVLKRTFEAYVRGDAPNMYGEWIAWENE
jgi:WD repeat and SOF domain-containing protein 1